MWNHFCVANPGLPCFKHAVSESWLQVARIAAKKDKVPSDPRPLFLNETDAVIGIRLFHFCGRRR